MSTQIIIFKDAVITRTKTASDRQLALNSLVSTMTANRVLRSDGTNLLLAQIDLTKDVTGVLPPANGGSGSSTNFVDLTTNQTVGGTKTFSDGLILPATVHTSVGAIWRNGNNLEFRNNANTTQVILNSAGNLSNLSDKQTSLNNLVGTQTANRILRSDGTNVTLSQVALDTDITNILSITNGGTGSNTKNFVDLSSTQTVGGTKTFTSPTRLQGQSPGFYLDETDGGLKSAYVILDNGLFQIQRRATNFGALEATPANLNILTGTFTLSTNVNSTSTTTGTFVCGGGAGFAGNIWVGGTINQTNAHSFRAAASVAQSVPTSVNTKLTLNNLVTDTNNQYDTTLSRLTAVTTETWRISAYITFNLTASGRVVVIIFKNGAEATGGIRLLDTTVNIGLFGQLVTAPELSLVAGDYLELFCFVNPAQNTFANSTLVHTFWFGKRIN